MDPHRFYLGARTWFGFCWTTMVTVNLVYMVKAAGLDPLQMVLVGTVLELSPFLFEIPTGVLANRVSRRLSVLIGHTMTGASFVLIVLQPNFVAILLAQLIWGVGYTFISGAYPAWLSEEIGVERANRAFVRGAQLAQGAGFFGIAFAIALAQLSLHLPMLIGGLGVIGLAGYLIETFTFPDLGNVDSVVWWGVIAAIGNLAGLAATSIAHRVVDRAGHRDHREPPCHQHRADRLSGRPGAAPVALSTRGRPGA